MDNKRIFKHIGAKHHQIYHFNSIQNSLQFYSYCIHHQFRQISVPYITSFTQDQLIVTSKRINLHNQLQNDQQSKSKMRPLHKKTTKKRDFTYRSQQPLQALLPKYPRKY